MLNFLKQKLNTYKTLKENKIHNENEYETPSKLTGNLIDDTVTIREKANNSADLIIRELDVSNIKVNVITVEGMTNTLAVGRFILDPLDKFQELPNTTAEDIYNTLQKTSVVGGDLNTVGNIDDIYPLIMSGFAIILINGINTGIAIGVQGFPHRSVSEPSGEMNIRGSREGFIEPIRPNMSLLRRKVKSPDLCFEMIQIGEKGKTDVCIVYIQSVVSKKLLNEVRCRLSRVKVDMLLDSGYLQPFLESNSLNMFSDVGVTERPDSLAAKLSEGRIGIMVDGTPFALVLPFLFVENFHSLDDYSHKPYYSTFVRILKYCAFFITVFLPGLYVAIVNFHPQILPYEFLFNVMSAEVNTHLPIVLEALIIHLIYEIMREAGLRLPRPIGHAVSIVGALVIGEAAVNAGIIAAPMIMIVALTALSAFVISSLYESISVLKFVFILLGGIFGLYGIVLGMIVLLIQICALNNFGVPYFAPVSPFSYKGNRDVLIRASWKTLGKNSANIQEFEGSNRSER